MPSLRSRYLRYLFQKNGEGSPALDILGLSVGLVILAGVSFWFAILAQFAGPAVEDGISPQIIASLQWSVIGLVFGALAVFVYQRRPICWFGAFTAAIGWLLLVVSSEISIDALEVLYVVIPSILGLLLLLRRDTFLS